jgi:two-component system phosphate regulon sensor histidine kinase PhoR
LLRDWQSHLIRILLVFTLLACAGFILDRMAVLLVSGLAAYLTYSTWQLIRLHRWLQAGRQENSDPPESRGLWGDVYDGIYRLQRQEKDAQDRLIGIINKAQESTAALDMGVVMINQKGNLEWWNQGAGSLLGLLPADRHHPVTNLLRDPEFLEYFDNGDYNRPVRLQAPVNRNMMLEYEITWFGDGERLMLVKDISQLHRLETMRRDFVGNVSHELRTPITVITGYLETLLDNVDSLESRWKKPLEQMYQQSRRMENIIRDLLALSELETKPVSRQRTSIDVMTLLTEIRSDAQYLYSEKQQQFIVEGETVCIRGNRSELYSALSNLVFNAAKYTQTGSRIVLSGEHSKHGYTVAVSDNGPGIDSQHIPRLTERFYRIDESRSAETGGTGLGLAIVKHVLARHNALLEIVSEPGKGSRFLCHFPAERLIVPTAGAELTGATDNQH